MLMHYAVADANEIGTLRNGGRGLKLEAFELVAGRGIWGPSPTATDATALAYYFSKIPPSPWDGKRVCLIEL